MDLVEFLAARLDEDERSAQAAAAALGDDWSFRAWGRSGEVAVLTGSKDTNMSYQGEGDFWETEGALGMPSAGARHIARHDPARVLREVKAKRAIMDLHPQRDDRLGCWACDTVGKPCDTFRLLALPYADHPDYRAEWNELAHDSRSATDALFFGEQ